MPGNVTGYLNQQRGAADAAMAARNLTRQQNTGQVLQQPPPGGPMSFSPPPGGGPQRGNTINFGGAPGPQRQYTPNPFIKTPPQGMPPSGVMPGVGGMPGAGGPIGPGVGGRIGPPPMNTQPVSRGNPYLIQALRARGG